ncbi:MAG: AbiEi antitoxin N-terminal domain-containing protein [Candidatus Methanoplasma sp.]|jgi:predicted transcriptional regulator of viral defense system|nr:AbiEi antitoxin N-terminal domain-containing protein [Candidatus Methanoplasma sp.]
MSKKVMNVSEFDRVASLISAAGDVITSKQVTNAGIHRSVLSDMVGNNELVRIGRGVYMRPTSWEDEMYLLQYRYGKGIFSHETALYLHGMSDRIPARFTMTFPWGYNAASLGGGDVTVKRTIRELHDLGVTEIKSPGGNQIRAYDIERTLCDIVRGAGIRDVSIINQAMKRYVARSGKNIHRLLGYAEKLRVESKILNYMEVLL